MQFRVLMFEEQFNLPCSFHHEMEELNQLVKLIKLRCEMLHLKNEHGKKWKGA